MEKEAIMTVRRSRSAALAVAAGLVALAALSCGGGDSPASSTPPVTSPPQPTPTPPPAGSGSTFYHASCPLGPGNADPTCARGKSSALLGEVEAAMDLLLKQKPEIFDLEDEYDSGTQAYRVKDREAYQDGLVANLRAAGLCAERDADDAILETIRVKSSSEFSEDFDVLLSSGHMRRGTGAYRQSCTPSAFPVERGADAPPIGSGCGRPYPPQITRFNCGVHLKGGDHYTLDSTPLVGPDVAYCASIGFPDRSICPVRPEGAPDREACENWRVGKAKDTGRPGPTWSKGDGSLCAGPDSGCQNHPDTQYQLWTFVGGTYVVTAENGASCKVTH
jgi:hypothetical protein